MKTVRICLLILASTVATSSLRAAEINPPDPRWNSPAVVETSTDNWSLVVQDTQEVSQAQDIAQQVPESANLTSAEPPKIASIQKKPAANQESHERVLGLAPMFNVVNDASKSQPLSVGEKWKLFYRQTYDPFQFATASLSAGIGQAQDQFPGYGQGMAGYMKRYGAGLADNSLGNFFGNFALPSLLHDDPRYFRKGSGTFKSRFLYSLSTTVVARRDDGSHHPNYSNVGGNLIGCAFGNLYYPQGDRGVGTTFARGFQVTGYGAIGAVFSEFWPDIHDRVFKKHKAADAK